VPDASVSAWRRWAESAPPDLREAFEIGCHDALGRARRRFPPDCGPHHPQYQDLKKACTCELNQLAERIEDDAEH